MEEYQTENGNQDYSEMPTEYQQDETYEQHTGEGDVGAAHDVGDKGKVADEDERKIFVGGLSWETTVKDLREYFSKFGEVIDCTLKTDPNTGRSRGFGFVTFSEVSAVDQVTEQSVHKLHERQIDPKRAKARGKPEPVKKVFVGGLDPTTTETEIRDYFNQYGKVLELDLPFDKMKGQRRAFCFITFESEEIVETVVKEPKQSLSGKEVDVKKATPRQDQQGGWQQGGWGYGGGRGGRGGFDNRGRGGRGRGFRGGGQGQGQGWGNQGWSGGESQNYDYSSYYGQQGNYGSYGNYDYSQYPGYGNYDYNNYYQQQGWGNYNQGGYGSQNYGNGYDYSGWYGNQQGGQQQQGGGQQNQQSNYKAKSGGQGGGRGGGYHPYQRQ